MTIKHMKLALAVSFGFLVSSSLVAQRTSPSDANFISGIVVQSGSQLPIVGATIDVSGAGVQRSATTDDQGSFLIEKLQPGRYSITSRKPGFIGKNKSSTTLSIVPGVPIKAVRLELIATGVITGRVLNEDRSPQPGKTVIAVKPTYEMGKRILTTCVEINGQSAETDDRGQYRLYGLEPGDYYMAVTDGRSCQYASQFYPTATDPGEAVPIKVIGGNTIEMDFSMRSHETHSVTFRVVSSDSMRSSGNAVVVMHGTNGIEVRAQRLSPGSRTLIQQSDNRYTIGGLPRGRYDIYFSTSATFGNIAHFTTDIHDRDVDVGPVVLGPLVPLTGRLRFPGTLSGQVRVRLWASEGPLMLRGIPLAAATVTPDGSFRWEYVPGRKYFVQVTGLPEDAYLVSVQYRGENALITGIAVGEEPEAPLELTASANGGVVEGIVRDDRGTLFVAGHVALVPIGTRRANVTLFRDIPIDSNGSFVIRGVAPGEYELFAWDDVAAGAWQDRTFLQAFESRPMRVSVREGSRQILNVRGIHSEGP